MNKNRFVVALAILTGLFVSVCPALAQPLSFSSTNVTFGSEEGPAQIIPVDVNGDGYLDLVSADFGFRFGNGFGTGGGTGTTISVFTNNGTGEVVLSTNITVGLEPASVATADVNGDGFPDLISANVGDNTLTVLTNDGKGNFAISGTYKVGDAPAMVTTADFNGDGFVDLVCANYQGNTMTVLTNDGHGLFKVSTNILVETNPNCVAAADINGDGKIDLICANSGSSDVDIYTNTGAGHFVHSVKFNVAGGATWVVAADVDRNGTIDLAVANNATAIDVFTNNGQGHFGLKSNATTPGNTLMMVAADMNGDGKVDLVCNDNGNSLQGATSILTNDGRGNFTVNTTIPVGFAGVDNYPNYVTVGDFTGDGNNDVVVSCFGPSTGPSVLTELFQVNVSPRPKVTIATPADGEGIPRTVGFQITTGIESPTSVRAVQFYANGNIIGTATGTPFLFNVSPGAFAAGSVALQAVAIDSDDVDGWSQVIHVNITSSAGGGGGPPPPQPLTFSKTTLPTGSGPSFVLPADIFGNGNIDLIVPDYGLAPFGTVGSYNGADGSNITVWVNNGHGVFSAEETIRVGGAGLEPALQPEPECVAAADLNGDGQMELIEDNFYYNTLGIFTDNGKGVFGTAGGAGTTGRGPVYLTVADVNGDGKPDIITANSYDLDHNISVLTNAGSFKFVGSSTNTVPSPPAWVAVADLNGDGKPDLVSADYGGGSGSTLTVMTNLGNGQFSNAATLTVGLGPVCVIAADVNGDGKIDLISADEFGNTLTVLTNDGHGNFTLMASIPVVQPTCIVATNLTPFGRVDLACANNGSGSYGQVTILTNDGLGNFTVNTVLSVGLLNQSTEYPNRIAAGDFNKDGEMDLVVANYGDNSLTVLTQSTRLEPAATVNITSVTNGESFFTTNTIVVNATISTGLQHVSLNVDGVVFATTTSAPYSFQIPSGTLAVGSHILEVAAVNEDNIRGASAVLTITVSIPGTVLIDFDVLNTSAGAVGGTILSTYLSGKGVTVGNVTTGTSLEAVNTNSLGGSVQVQVPSPPNFFTQAGSDEPMSFTLRLANPAQAFKFTRAGLSSASGMVSHPQWTATALDSRGDELGSVSEGLIVSAQPVVKKQFTLTGNGIAAVRFDSDSRQTAAFSAVLLDNLTLDYNNVAAPLSVTLSVTSPPTNQIVAPATLGLSAAVNDQFSASYSVSFFAGPALLGTVTSSPYQLTVPGVLPGQYELQARVVDESGQAAESSVVPITVQVGPDSTLVDFDPLAASRGPVEGTALAKYLSSNGMVISNLTAGTVLAVENQANIAGGHAVMASSASNILTQIGPSGLEQFTVRFARLVSQFGFTRPELLANPYVSHPAWQATAFDGAGVVLDEVTEGEIESDTNVAAREFSLAAPAGEGIVSVTFASQSTGLTTFNALLLDDLVLTTNPAPFPPAVAITQPVNGQALALPPALTVTATAFDPNGITGVSFLASGTQIGAALRSPYTITWTNPPEGSYVLRAIATNVFGLTRISPAVHVTIEQPGTQFGILSPPASQTVVAGGSATFTVAASGIDLAYAWSHNGQPIPGATSSALVLAPPITTNDAGNYTVAVSSAVTEQKAGPATLTVLEPPGFTTQPQGQTVPAGTDVTLNASASGNGPFTWQWLLNGTSIPGATISSYFIPSAQPLNSGNYQVVVNNGIGSAPSTVASVVVETPFTAPPSNDNFSNRISINPLLGPVSDSNVLATVEPGEPKPDGLTGGKSIWFKWTASFTGTISLTTEGSDFDTLLAVYTGTKVSALKLVAADDDSGGYLTSLVTFNVTAGTEYEIDVDGYEGASGRVVLGLPDGTGFRILSPVSGDSVPVILRGPASKVVAPNGSATLTVLASSATKVSYQWYFQGAPIARATASSLVVSHVGPGTVGQYYVVVANAAGPAQSAPATLETGSALNEAVASSENKFVNAPAVPSPKLLAFELHPLALGGDTRGFSVAQTFSTVGATTEPGEPEPCGQVGGASQWFVYTAPAAGTMQINANGSTFNTLFGVYTGNGESFSNLMEMGCGYTTNYLTEGLPSVVLEGVTEGETFYILFEGYQGASGVAHLNVGLGTPLVFHTMPASQLITAGTNTTFTATAIGSTPLTYQWQLNGVNVAGATASALRILAAKETAAGNYTVIASNILGVVTSSPPAALSLQYAPDILTGPSNVSVKIGAAAKFAVTALGVNVRTNAFHCQWYFDGVSPLKSATGLSLLIPVTRTTNAGTYTIVISNSYGALTSAPAILTLFDTAGTAAQSGVIAEEATGGYNGLFYPDEGTTEANAGYFAATVSSAGTGEFSANLLLDGSNYPFSGRLDFTGQAQSVIARTGKSSVTVQLQLDVNPPDGQLTGIVSTAEWRSNLRAGRPGIHAAGTGVYALAQAGAPAGSLTVTNLASGAVLVTGTLADGAKLFRAAPVLEEGTIPLYVPLYSGQGAFLGWISPSNNAFWILPGSTNAIQMKVVK